jgi:hypothetical protein
LISNDDVRNEFSDKESALDVYQYIKNNYAMEFYYGSRKGAVGASAEKAGNDYDIASTLIGVLRDRNIPARYTKGMIEITAEQAMDWTATDDINSAMRTIVALGIPTTALTSKGKPVAVRIEHVWVEVYVPYTDYRGTGNKSGKSLWIPLDASFKKSVHEDGVKISDIKDYLEDSAEYLDSLKDSATTGNIYSEKVMGGLLDSVSKLYFGQLDLYNSVLAGQTDVTLTRALSLGIVGFKANVTYAFSRPAELSESGIFLDIGHDVHTVVSVTGEKKNEKKFMLQAGIYASAMEHGVLEQTTGIESVSTIKTFQYAKEHDIQLHTIVKDNLSDELNAITVSDQVKKDIRSAVNAGRIVIIPEKEITINQWSGIGYMVLDPDTYACGYMISGGMAGGSMTASEMISEYVDYLVEGVVYAVVWELCKTIILAVSGLIPIENVRAGDKVYSFNADTQEVSKNNVEETFVRESNELVHITVNGETISSTPDHPFYVPQKGFVRAINLRAGDILWSVNGEYVVVEKVQHEILESPVKVFNFRVADNHTYFVGNNCIAVHNSGCAEPNLKAGNLKNCDSNSDANKIAKQLGFDDAHDFKRAFVKNISRYDMKYDTKTKEIWLVPKRGGQPIETGYKKP